MLSSRNGLRQRAGSQQRGQLLQTSEEHPRPWASVVASSGGTTGSSRQARLLPGRACLYVTGPLTLLGLLLSAEGALREPYENDGPTVAADMEADRETEAKLRAAAVPPAAVFSRVVSLLPSLPPLLSSSSLEEKRERKRVDPLTCHNGKLPGLPAVTDLCNIKSHTHSVPFTHSMPLLISLGPPPWQ